MKLFHSPFMKGGESSSQDSDATTSLPPPLPTTGDQKGNLLSFCLLCLFESANDEQIREQNQRKFSRTYAVVARVLFKLAEPMPLWQGLRLS